mgnify:CR=1 FL=1
MSDSLIDADILRYIIEHQVKPGERLPTIPELSTELDVSVSKIREVLELGPGSVVELDKLAGEPVDILVNEKLFAKGEVVVIDENFGVRITDILTIEERIEALK